MENSWQEWEECFQPVSGQVLAEDYNAAQWGAHLKYFSGNNDFPDVPGTGFDIVLLGCGYDMEDLSASCNQTPDSVRHWFYRLYKGDYAVRVADLGNFSLRRSVEETCLQLGRIMAEIQESGAVPLLIGGGSELNFSMYRSFTLLGRYANLLEVSPVLHFKEVSEALTPENVLGRMLGEDPQMLFHYCNLGYQTYFNPPELLGLFKQFHFDLMRLGEVRSRVETTEPLIRDAHLVGLNMAAVRKADVPHAPGASPNGLAADEICRLARYAGLSHKLRAVALTGLAPDLAQQSADAHLAAQVIWHVLEGFYVRKPETLEVDAEPYLRFTVPMKGFPEEITFYKNQVSEKWWMGVPVAGKWQTQMKLEEYLVPCGMEDYEAAAGQELPERWLQRFHKLND